MGVSAERARTTPGTGTEPTSGIPRAIPTPAIVGALNCADDISQIGRTEFPGRRSQVGRQRPPPPLMRRIVIQHSLAFGYQVRPSAGPVVECCAAARWGAGGKRSCPRVWFEGKGDANFGRKTGRNDRAELVSLKRGASHNPAPQWPGVPCPFDARYRLCWSCVRRLILLGAGRGSGASTFAACRGRRRSASIFGTRRGFQVRGCVPAIGIAPIRRAATLWRAHRSTCRRIQSALLLGLLSS